MARIDVRSAAEPGGWRLSVEIDDGQGRSRHEVTLTKADFERLSQGSSDDPSTLVRKSFEFLLEREPKESILSRFELPVIGRYFPDYEKEIRKRLG